MTGARRHPAALYLTLKGAARQLVKRAGGQEAAAAVSRVRPQQYSIYGNPADEFACQHMPTDIVADLEAEIGEPVVTRALAAVTGHLVVRAPAASLGGCSMQALGRLALENGQAVESTVTALAEGRSNFNVEGPVIGQIDEAIDAYFELRARLLAGQGGGDG